MDVEVENSMKILGFSITLASKSGILSSYEVVFSCFLFGSVFEMHAARWRWGEAELCQVQCRCTEAQACGASDGWAGAQEQLVDHRRRLDPSLATHLFATHGGGRL